MLINFLQTFLNNFDSAHSSKKSKKSKNLNQEPLFIIQNLCMKTLYHKNVQKGWVILFFIFHLKNQYSFH
jgi:hypothetical protein